MNKENLKENFNSSVYWIDQDDDETFFKKIPKKICTPSPRVGGKTVWQKAKEAAAAERANNKKG